MKTQYSQCLQLHVETQREVSARNRLLVELAVPVASLYPSAGVAQQYLYSFLSPELSLIRTLYAHLADIVAGKPCKDFHDYFFSCHLQLQ